MPPTAADVTRLVQAAVVPAVFTCGLSMLFLYIASSADPMNRFAVPTVSGDGVAAQVRVPSLGSAGIVSGRCSAGSASRPGLAVCLSVQLKRLATFSDDPNPAVTRILFTDADMNARRCAALRHHAFICYDASEPRFTTVQARRWLGAERQQSGSGSTSSTSSPP